MYTEGMADLNIMVLHYPFLPPGEQETNLAQIKDKTKNRYFSAFEKVGASPLRGAEGLIGCLSPKNMS